MVGRIKAKVVKQKGVSRVVGVTAYIVAQETPEPSAAPEVAKEPEVTPSARAEPEASKAPEAEPIPERPAGRSGESLLAGCSMVQQEFSSPVDQNLEDAFSRIRSFVQVTLLNPFPLLPSPQVFSG